MNKYDWIKPGVHAWVAGLVCPVEVEVVRYAFKYNWVDVECGTLYSEIEPSDLYQTESECLAAMKKEL